MKNIYIFITGLLLLFCSTTTICNDTTAIRTVDQQKAPAENTLTIISTPELLDLAGAWATEYSRLNPGVIMTVNSYPANGKISGNSLYFFSEGYSGAINNATNWKMPVAREAVVIVLNADNPLIDELFRQGVSSEKLAQAFTDTKKRNWMSMIRTEQHVPANFYSTNHKMVKENVAKFTKTDIASMSEITVIPPEQFVLAVRKDPYAIGFCKLSDVLDAKLHQVTTNIKLLPIDKNNNGRMDTFEKIYDNPDAFTRGVWIGKYPKPLCGNVYVTSPSKPENKNTLAFLSWILADGQQFLNPNGYSNLTSSVKQSNLEALKMNFNSSDQSNKPFISRSWFLSLAGLISLVLIGILMVISLKKEKSKSDEANIGITPGLDENSVLAPKGLYFDKTHTWAFMEKDGLVKVGIDDFLQHITGTLTRIKMKGTGEKIRKGEKILTIIRNGKQLDICAPASGVIKEQNQLLATDPSLINSSPYADGWVYLIEPKNWQREIQFLFAVNRYKSWLQNEFTRLKDFFSALAKSNTAVYQHIILQDGGEITDNILADLGPEIWEDFQTNFLNKPGLGIKTGKYQGNN